MKLKWVLCGIFVYSIFINAVFAEEDATLSESDEIVNDCTVQHLKNKGMLDADVVAPGNTSPIVCRFAMTIAVGLIREAFEEAIKIEFPDAMDCIMKKFNENSAFDDILKMGYIEKNKALTDEERKTQAENNEKQIKDQMKKIASSCELDEEKFIKVLETAFDTSSEETATATE